MQSFRFGCNSDTHVIPNLIDVLGRVPPNNWVWSVLEFDGIGNAPDGLHMADFQESLSLLEKGWIVGWDQLVDFAKGIQQASWCFIVAVDSVEKLKKPIEVDEAPEDCIIALEAFDSSEWTIWSDDDELLYRFDSLLDSFVRKEPSLE